MTRKSNQSGQAYLQSGLMRHSSRNWSMTSSYLDRGKSTSTYSETLIIRLWLHQSGWLVCLLCMDRCVSQERKNMISVVLKGGKHSSRKGRHLILQRKGWMAPTSQKDWTDRGMHGCMHWRNIIASIVIMFGLMNLTSCRRRRSNGKSRTKTKSSVLALQCESVLWMWPPVPRSRFTFISNLTWCVFNY